MLNFLNIRGTGEEFSKFKNFFFSQKLNPPSPGRGVNFTEQGINIISNLRIRDL